MKHKEIPVIMHSITSHDRSLLRFAVGVRNAIGMALPLIIGLLTGEIPAAIVVTLGALVTGFAGMNGTSRLRFRTMLLAIIWLSITTGVGTLSGHLFLTSVVLAVLSGFLAGLMVAVSPAAALVGILATQSMIIFMAFPADPLHALYQTLLVALGGFLQIGLMWAHDRFSNETEEGRSVVSVFTSVSAFVETRTRAAEKVVVQALVSAESQLNDSRLPKPVWLRLRILLDLIEQIRNTLVALKLSLRVLEKQTVDHADQSEELWSTFYRNLRFLIDEIAVRIVKHSGTTEKITALTDVENSAQALQLHLVSQAELDTNWLVVTKQIDYLRLVVGQLLATLTEDPSTLLANNTQTSRTASGPTRTFWQPVKTLLLTLRANLTWNSAAMRHAVRVAVTLGVAVILYRAIPLARGYWVPMTALLILRPDFFTTVGRGVSRMLGTAIGVVLATALVSIPDQSHLLSIIWIVVFAVLMFTVINYNYALFSVFITSEIVVLLSFFEHMAPFTAARDRLLDTLLGGALALIAFSVWPTWQRMNVPGALGDFLHTVRSYLRALLVDPTTETSSARKAIRLARTNAVAVVDQMLSEPAIGTLDSQSVVGFLTALHRFVDGLLTLEVGFRNLDPSQQIALSSAAKQEIGISLDKSLQQLELVIRSVHSESETANHTLRELLKELAMNPPQGFASTWDEPYLRSVAQRMRGIVATMASMLPLSSPLLTPSTSKEIVVVSKEDYS